MSTYTQILYQIIFGTKGHKPVMRSENRAQLYRYLWGILRKKQCHPYCINGVEDHLHIITHLHPTVSLASIVKDIKIASSVFIKRENLFPDFSGWQAGYGGFTYSIQAKEDLIKYVNNQVQHHRKISFREEYIQLLKQHGVAFYEKKIW